MATEGMDVEVVEGIGNKLKAQGEQIQGIIGKIEGLVNQAESTWKGKDSTTFKGEWDGQLKGMLTNAKVQIEALGTEAIAQAKDQAAASAS